jgi:type IV secretory pathway VirB10-like protein
MEASILLQIIRDDIKILNNLAVDLSKDSGITRDEVEIVLTRARNVVRELELLESKVTGQEETIFVNKVIEPHPDRIEKPLESKPVDPVTNPMETEEDKQPEPNKTSEPQAGTEEKTEQAPVEQEQEPEEETDMELLEVEQTEKRTLGESVAAQRSLNDMIGEDHQEDAFAKRPLKSIREGISLNDRYLFVRELFGNSNEKFNEAVDTLDHARSIQEAVHFLKSNFKWSKTETSQKFLTLVKRRFLN